MPAKRYKIFWISEITGKQGEGEATLSEERATELCNTMNKEYRGQITHLPIPIEDKEDKYR